LFYAIFGGKFIGAGVCLLLALCASLYFGSAAKVHAQKAPAATVAPATAAAPAPVRSLTGI